MYEPKNYLADNENYLADSKNYLADSGARNGLCRAQPNFRASECRGQASLVLCRAADKGAFYIDQLVELCVKCLLQKAVHAPCSLCWLHKWGGLKCRANEGNRACSYCRVQPTLCKAQLLHIAPGNALGSDVALIKVSRSVRAACIMRGNAPLGVKGINGLRAFGAWHFCASAKMPNVSIAVYVPPGRCPGLWATFGLCIMSAALGIARTSSALRSLARHFMMEKAQYPKNI